MSMFRRAPEPPQQPEPIEERATFLRRPPRCDRCPAAARVLVASPTLARRPGGTPWRPTLVLCSHHYRFHGAILAVHGWTVELDTRGEMVAQEDGRLRDPRPGHPRSDPPR